MKNEKAASEPVVAEPDVLAYLARSHVPASIREIAHALALRHAGRRALPKVLAQLRRRGQVEEIRGGRYRLIEGRRWEGTNAAKPGWRSGETQTRPRDANLLEGRFVGHRDGYGFVVPETPVPGMEGDLFVGRDHLGDAMHGDRVLARIERRRPDARAEGRIVRILERAQPTVVGLFRYGPHGNSVLPYDARVAHEVVIPPNEELTPGLRQKLRAAGSWPPKGVRLAELDGAVVNVELTRFPRGGVAPAGRVVEILGRPGEIGVDVELIIRKHHLPHQFSEAALAEATLIPQQVNENELVGRRDFRELPVVTIDGETARDFDDAVYVAALPGGCFDLQVHIADVAHYVRRASELDREARLRGTSVYFPDRAVPMLPEALSNGICSLNPQVDRLVMSALMKIDEAGRVARAEFCRGVIRSAERMTYTNVNKVLEDDAEMRERYASLAGRFGQMRELALRLHARRSQRGSIDFDLPEPVIEFDEAGRMVGIVRSERNIAHRIIEEFMLAANEAVARYLQGRGIGSLHRVHEKPDPKKIAEFEELARAFGYSLGVVDLAERRIVVRHGQVRPRGSESRAGHGRMRSMAVAFPAAELDIRPRHYQRLTEKIAGKPEERILSYLMLRSLKQARYAAEPLGHFALALEEYAHFTSPIRRYPDLIVHRALKWALDHPEVAPTVRPETIVSVDRKGFRPGSVAAQSPPDFPGPYRRVELEEIAEECSEAERRADSAERELLEWKTAQFMEQHLGEEYDALIISVQKFGFFVELTEIFVEGLAPIDRIEETLGVRCIYRERDHAIVAERKGMRRAQPGQTIFRLGDRLNVRAERVDPMRHRVEFAPLV